MIFFYKESKSKKKLFGGSGREGPGVSDFFYYYSKSKMKKSFFLLREGGGVWGWSKFILFLTINPKFKIIKTSFFFGGGGGGGGGGVGGWSK